MLLTNNYFEGSWTPISIDCFGFIWQKICSVLWETFSFARTMKYQAFSRLQGMHKDKILKERRIVLKLVCKSHHYDMLVVSNYGFKINVFCLLLFSLLYVFSYFFGFMMEIYCDLFNFCAFS